MLVTGIMMICLAHFYFIAKAYLSYTSEGGAIGMVPVLDGGFVPPFLALFGISFVERATGWPGLPGWTYVLAWFVCTFLGFVAIVRFGEWGKRRR